MKRAPIVATIVVVLAIAIMIGLGFWQLQRRSEKEALLAQYAANIVLPPIAFPQNPVGDTLLFRKAVATCLEPTAWHERSGRNAQGNTGWRQIAQCRAGAAGSAMTVQVGLSAQPRGTPDWKGGRVSGYITHAPDDQPLILALIGMAHPKTLMLVTDAPAPGLSANPAPDLSAVPNNHLAYAVQWFIFAALAGIFYTVAVRHRLKATPAVTVVPRREVADTPPGR
ncbi:SURF1 family protein [Sphingomonas endolithica]|uniref:SURF1 family protein n=1 Tax=Sphingomonas endolithica TaxID=2972485 RepID=UPI0021AE6416|nr:SURF1 family protein [Sphingomonas sp. ZFBP2030]